jgi:hypothetical protein
MIYHNIRSFGREDGKEPRHLELYFYDDDPSLEHRYRRCHEEQYQKDKEVIDRLVAIIRDNLYSQHLRNMGQAEQLEDYRLTLNLFFDVISHLTLINDWTKGHTMCRWLQRCLLFGSRIVNSLVSFRIVLSCMGKIGAGMTSDHTMDAMMLFHTHSSSLAVSLDDIWIYQRKVLLWRMSTWLVPYVRLVVVLKKKKKHVCLSSYTFMYIKSLSQEHL